MHHNDHALNQPCSTDCGRRGTVHHEGLLYCPAHAPLAYIAARLADAGLS